MPPSYTYFYSTARASLTQTRIWFDECSHFDSKVAINNIVLLYQIEKGSLSIDRLRRALRFVTLKHGSLRTLFFIDPTTNCLMQRIIQPEDPEKELFAFVETKIENDFDLKAIIKNDKYNRTLFDLSSGRNFHVNIITQRQDNCGLLQKGDFLLFNFHQIAFDIPSLDLFHQDLRKAYDYQVELSCTDNQLLYIDYAAAEQFRPMKLAEVFWHELMFDFDWHSGFTLPIDHRRDSNEKPIGLAYRVEFTFDDDIVISQSNRFMRWYECSQAIPSRTERLDWDIYQSVCTRVVQHSKSIRM
ncbi:unnamed protein product [Rotaria sp. Silwood2]|nr:unnamed protein product [Rotaria sp. Silwood2]CAF4551051.1 unnamed protein product [Rotaria sp. Silwood2]